MQFVDICLWKSPFCLWQYMQELLSEGQQSIFHFLQLWTFSFMDIQQWEASNLSFTSSTISPGSVGCSPSWTSNNGRPAIYLSLPPPFLLAVLDVLLHGHPTTGGQQSCLSFPAPLFLAVLDVLLHGHPIMEYSSHLLYCCFWQFLMSLFMDIH